MALTYAALAFSALLFGLYGSNLDARAYWDVPPQMYTGDLSTTTYHYSPAFAWWTAPIRMMPVEVMTTLVAIANVAALTYLVGPYFALALIVSQLQPITAELQHGNLNLVIGALAVIGFRHPWVWSFALLTKVLPGIGLLWFAIRGEWRALFVCGLVTLAFALPSLLLEPQMWVAWVESMIGEPSAGPGRLPIWVAGIVAVIVIAWGAKTDREWVVPLGVGMFSHGHGRGYLSALGVVKLGNLDDAGERQSIARGPSHRQPRTGNPRPRGIRDNDLRDRRGC